jgi:CheY-like chemotaxis protein
MDSRTCTAVLVVEDDLAIRDQVTEFLAREGFHVYRAEHGAEALRVLAAMPRPALVLADMMT